MNLFGVHTEHLGVHAPDPSDWNAPAIWSAPPGVQNEERRFAQALSRSMARPVVTRRDHGLVRF